MPTTIATRPVPPVTTPSPRQRDVLVAITIMAVILALLLAISIAFPLDPNSVPAGAYESLVP